MSLKFFHIVFISLSTLLALGAGLWTLDTWRTDGDTMWLALAVLAFGGGAGLVVYGNRFLQKVRKLGIAGLLVAGTLGLPADALACAVCIGNSTSPLRSGLSLGILALLGITGFMLVCFASFFVYLALKARSAGIAGPVVSRPGTEALADS
jgi:hypothetical protein